MTGRVKTDLGECNLRVTGPDRKRSESLVFNPLLVSKLYPGNWRPYYTHYTLHIRLVLRFLNCKAFSDRFTLCTMLNEVHYGC